MGLFRSCRGAAELLSSAPLYLGGCWHLVGWRWHRVTLWGIMEELRLGTWPCLWHCCTLEGFLLLTTANGQDPGVFPAPAFPVPGCRGRVLPGSSLSRLCCARLPRHPMNGSRAYQCGCKNELLCCINIFTLLSSH